jgi:hypothetical protein
VRAEQLKLKPPLAHQFSIVGAAASIANPESFKCPPIEAVMHLKTDLMLTYSVKFLNEAISEFISPSFAVQMLVQLAILEKMIVTTAKSRRCLSEYIDLCLILRMLGLCTKMF